MRTSSRRPQTVSRRAAQFARLKVASLKKHAILLPDEITHKISLAAGWAHGYRAGMRDVAELISQYDTHSGLLEALTEFTGRNGNTARLK